VKHSQVAGLAAGWLTVALSMAAIGTAAVGRVGMGTAEALVQVTVTKSVTVGIYGPGLAPAEAPGVVTSEYGTRTVSITEFARSAATRPPSASTNVQVSTNVQASTNVQVSTTVPQPTPASGGVAMPPVVEVPASEKLRPENGTPTTSPTATPTRAKPTKVTTPKKSDGSKTATATVHHSVKAVTFAAWSQPQGAVRAGYKGTQLALVEP
jgi:heme-binding NEAT domain protein